MSARSTLIAVACLLGGAAGWQCLESGAAQEAPHQGRSPGASSVRPAGGEGESATLGGAQTRVLELPLRSATTPAEVREVLRVTREATLQDRAELVDAALRAEDPLVAGCAVRALGRLGVFSDEPRLLALTADPRPRVRQDAVVACGLDGDPAAIPHLQQALAEGDATLTPLALEALGRIGGPIARDLLERVASDPNSTEIDRIFVRSALARSSERGGGHFSRPAKRRPVVPQDQVQPRVLSVSLQ